MPENIDPPRYYNGETICFKICVPPLKVDGRPLFLDAHSCQKKVVPHTYYKGGPYILKYVVPHLRVINFFGCVSVPKKTGLP